ncbi:MAG: tetratricopeptide repeat protein [Alphaproteobacteria bacterium]|nr:tetratricopeptide repeat protein [Alphaproteobacteria bacterium]
MTRFSLALFLAMVAMLCAGDADARRSRGKAKPVQPAETSTGQFDNNALCDGGMMITSDDQIKGCTALLKSGRLTRERKAVALYNRGNAYVGKNDFARAIQDYTDALANKNDYGQAYFNRAVAYRISGEPQLSVSDYTSALSYLPNDADAFAGRGTAYVKIGKHEKALEDFNRALAIQPNNLGALTQRGHAYVRNQHWSLAIADYDSALAITTANVEAIYGRGVAKVYSGDLPGGQSDMTTALTVDSSVTARMTSQGIPPPQIRTKTEPQQIVRPAPANEPAKETPPVSDASDVPVHRSTAFGQ